MRTQSRYPFPVFGLCFAFWFLTCGDLLLARPDAPAPPAALEAWMPEDVIGYAKLNGLGERLQEFLGSELRRELESVDFVRAALSQEPWQKFQSKLKELQAATGKEPLQLFRDLLGSEVVIGARLGFMPEVLVITRAAGERELESALQALRAAAAKELGQPLEPARSTYSDCAIETYDKISLSKFGPILAISNSQLFLQKAIDLARGKSSVSVKSSALFQKAAASSSKDAMVMLSVRPQFLPNFKLPEKVDNPVGSLLLSGWLGALEKSDLVTVALSVRDGKLGLEVASVLGQGGIAEKYRSFFPDVGPDSLARRLEKRGVLGIAQIHRNLMEWWERREDLLEPKAAGGLIEFSQIMSVVFQGRNFQDEVLPEFGTTITLVARNQEYADLAAKPKPAIPAFALIFELKKAQEFGNSLVGAFQSFVSIINLDQAQKKKEGAMAMVQKTEKVGDVELHTVALNLRKETQPGLIHNFTPSMGVVGSRVFISSSLELARILAEELSSGSKAEAQTAVAAPAADRIVIDAEAVHSILDLNRDIIIADNMTKKGHSKEQAENELKVLFEIVKRLRDVRLESKKEGDVVKVNLELRTRAGGAQSAPAKKAATTAGNKRSI